MNLYTLKGMNLYTLSIYNHSLEKSSVIDTPSPVDNSLRKVSIFCYIVKIDTDTSRPVSKNKGGLWEKLFGRSFV
jgi:hypothetical protein